ncbi:MAG: septum formation initiator family protein [Spirochaetaceae bacterium]|jgi:cell division protein FtsB|nr:septum formation initiator family protein [Spirochaetaceae bacterium]GMO19625.1 MAG: hypothetical protein Pg6A_06370 [Termitinemataceae bacterium]
MPVIKYCIAHWIALIFYAAASFFYGSMGLGAYKKLEEGRIRQIENIAELRRMNDALRAEKEALSYDAETITQEAINIGYGRDGETYIHIEGFHDSRSHKAEPGEVFKPSELEAVEDEVIKIYAIGIFIIVTAAIGFTDIVRFIRRL